MENDSAIKYLNLILDIPSKKYFLKILIAVWKTPGKLCPEGEKS